MNISATRLLTSRQMQQADHYTIEKIGIPGLVLMENAGSGVARIVLEKLKELRRNRETALKSVTVLAGRGNNGGDGFVIARHLLLEGVPVSVTLLAPLEKLQGDAETNARIFASLKGRIHVVTEKKSLETFEKGLIHTAMIVDAVFGTGLTKPVEGLIADLFEQINQSGKPVLAVDIPSGVSSDNGQILGVGLRARWTVALAAEKIGHRSYPGAEWCGEMIRIQIGIPDLAMDQMLDRTTPSVSRNQSLKIPPRSADAHKGSFGHLLVVAGSVGKVGAAVLTARGALRGGAGLVTVATPSSAQAQVASHLIEAMTLSLPEKSNGQIGPGAIEILLDADIKPTALALGPGLGVNRSLFTLIWELRDRMASPTVLDADALNVFAKFSRKKGETRIAELTAGAGQKSPLIVTPHPGEMARLLGASVKSIQENRLTVTLEAAQKWGCWVVLKGAGTVIASPDGKAWINDTGNVGLASGGSGDLLTGIIAGFLAQGWSVESAVRNGVWLHGAAADRAAGIQQNSGGSTGLSTGLLASDLLAHFRALLNELSASGVNLPV